MGTQQILMVVLSVIVVGTAVAIGIQMFDTQGQNIARNALVSDLMRMGVEAQAWFRTPRIMGGGGSTTDEVPGQHPWPPNALELMVKYIDANAIIGTGAPTIRNENGTFTYSFGIGPSGPELRIVGESHYKSSTTIRASVLVALDQGHAGIKVDPHGTDIFTP